MKKRVIVCLLSSAALFSCQKNEISIPIQEDVEVYASMEGMAKTKTILDENNNVLWSSGDQLTIFKKNTLGLKYQVIEDYVGKNYGGFSRVLSEGDDNVYAGVALDHWIVYYPYSDGISCSKADSNEPVKSYELTGISLPPEQLYVSGSFSNGVFPMVAVSEDNNIVFKNVCGGIKLQLKGTQKVTSITLQGKNSEKLSGAATVTAYTDETKPAIAMSDDAFTSVTLECGNGVQLNESTVTEFILALPPMLFTMGFTVTVTDDASQTYTVETDKANTILRSSLLVMPAFKLGETPGDDSVERIVETVIIDRTSLTMTPNISYTFEADVDPIDASNKTLTWSSSAPSVAIVEQDGTVTAISDGTAVISAVALGGASASCTVIVVSPTAIASADYEDEYGVNHGKGTVIGSTVWAPVNCGYKAATSNNKGFPYGKLYQWGRKYGQGYDSNDASYPSGDNLVEGPVILSIGLSEDNKDKFYYNSVKPYDWSKVQNDQLWNSGTDDKPVKTENDPCPTGWRVPTYAELDNLNNNYSSWTTSDRQKGYYFSGDYTCSDNAPQMFFPATGNRNDSDGKAMNRDTYGNYWSSRSYGTGAYYLYFGSSLVNMFGDDRARGYSIRCVQE